MHELSDELRLDIDRAAEGESILWAGVEGTPAQVVGVWLIAGAIAAVLVWTALQLFGLVAMRDFLREMTLGVPGSAPAQKGFGAVLLLASATMLWSARRFTRHAGRVVWAVTPTRLIRRIPGIEAPPLVWRRGAVRAVTLRTYENGRRQIEVAVTPSKEGADASRVFINGSNELDAAEAPLRALIGDTV